jgi:hypothetical protein
VNKEKEKYPEFQNADSSVLFGDDRSIATVILTKKDGLTRPSILHISPNGKHLLVINNDNRQMLLFDII